MLERDEHTFIAATGHRDIAAAAIDAARRDVDRVLAELASRHGGAGRLRLLNALAIGADSLVFDVAHARGIPIIAFLPLTTAEYEKDFAAGEERDAFHRRLALCHEVWQPEVALARPDCYQALGASLVQHADILLALWDGVENGAPGGTADVLRMAREQADSCCDSCSYVGDALPRRPAGRALTTCLISTVRRQPV